MNIGLREMVGDLLDSLGQKKALESLDPPTQHMLDKALNKVLEGTDRKISLVPGYKRKLYNSIIQSLQYADSIVEQIPHPIELGSHQVVSDPYTHAFFYTTTGLKMACNQSSELKEYFQEPEHRDCSEICALLCMRKEEENILGMELRGDHVIKDVKQTRLIFVNHRIQSPAENERVARRELKCCLFEGLVNNVLANISELRATRRQLETKQRMLGSRIRSHHSESASEEALSLTANNGVTPISESIKLQQIGQKLDEIGYVTPETSLDQVNATLGHPENFISIKKVSVKLDKDGILRSGDENADSVSQLNLSEVSIKGQPPRVVTLVKIKRDELDFSRALFPKCRSATPYGPV